MQWLITPAATVTRMLDMTSMPTPPSCCQFGEGQQSYDTLLFGEKQIKNLLVGVWGNSTKKEKREKSVEWIFLFFCENVDFCNACSSSMSNLKTVSNFQNCKILSLSKNRKPKILQKQISPSLEKTVY